MGLMDVLNGMQNGPHGARGSIGSSSSGGGMSPVTMAVLGLLAYKALKSFTSQPNASAATPGSGTAAPSGQQANSGGGLGRLLKGGLGGLLAGGAAGSVLSGGLNDLLKQFQQAGQGSAVNSWVGSGPNNPVTPDILSKVLDSDQVNTLMAHSGLTQDQLMAALSQYLPQVVDEMTPNGRPPTEHEAQRLIQ
jgi:uncharacterized protein YidB (DUF937 family)